MLETQTQIQETIKNNPKSLPLHWHKLFKRIFNKHFVELSEYEQNLIAGDNEHRFSIEFKNFIVGQVAKIFLDDTQECNAAHTWKISKKTI